MSFGIKKIHSTPASRSIKPVIGISGTRKYNGSANPVINEQQRIVSGEEKFSDCLERAIKKFDMKI